ncbi:MAG: Fe-S protein assembly co-chaperone HscB [Saprospiraceae bacterium]
MKEDYFTHFGIPRAYHIDLNNLRKKFYELSRNLHPDMNVSSSSKSFDDELITYHNLAYKTLLDPIARLKYLLEIEGAKELIERPLDPEFLMDMMDLHEEIDQAVQSDNEEKKSTLLKKLDQFEEANSQLVQASILLYDEGTRNESIIKKMVSYFVQLRYFRRLRKALMNEEEI